VLAFARKWGLLVFCHHEMPASHDLLSPTGRTLGCDPPGGGHFGGWEPISLWKGYAREAYTILLAAVAITDGRPWLTRAESEFVWGGFLAARAIQKDPEHQELHSDGNVSWVSVALAVNRWLAMGDVRPTLFSHEDPPPGGLEILYGGAGTAPWRPECRLFGA